MMRRKTTLLAAAALSALALAALPGMASGFETTPAIDPVAPASFPLAYGGAGGVGTLFTASGRNINCEGSSSEGSLVSRMTGSAKVTFTGCADSILESKCTTPGQTSGTIVTEELVTHMVYLKPANAENPHERPGILFTPNSNGKFTTFNCVGGLVTIEVKGNGVLGTVTAPSIGGTSSSFSLSVRATSSGQEHTETVEGEKFGLESNVNKGAFGPAYLQAGSTTATFVGGAEVTTTT